MSDWAQQRAERGAASTPLSNEQRQKLALLARRAFAHLDGIGMLGRDEQDFDTWRHRQCLQVAERDGLKLCRNEDFCHLKAHFLRLSGQVALADKVEFASASDDRRRALAVLTREIAAARDVIEDPRRYVETIAASKFKREDIERDLTSRQVWTLVFDIRRAAQKRRARRAA